MLKSFYKKLIITAFGQYLENFDDKIIEVSSWEGNFKAENLIIKKDALGFLSQKLGIPIEIEFGLIKKIELQIEWDKILSSSSYIFLSDVHLLAKTSHSYEPAFHEIIKAGIKNSEIEKKFKSICENIFNEKYSDTNFSPNITWKQKLLKSFTQNINIVIDNIHVRFEENYDIKKFNFGVAISRLEWLNTNKNGEEYFMDYETRKSIGKTFSMAKLYRLSVYFNSNGSNFNEEESSSKIAPSSPDNLQLHKNNLIKNFSAIYNSNDNNKNLINYINLNQENIDTEKLSISKISLNQDRLASFNESKISNSHPSFRTDTNNNLNSTNTSKKTIKNILPPVYEQYFEFSSKIFNFSSLEYSNQYFVIDAIDISVKFRKNFNPIIQEKLPLVSIFFETSHDLNVRINDSILFDLIYLFNLKKYHADESEKPALGIKKDFMKMKEKFTTNQNLNLFKRAIEKIKKPSFNSNTLLKHLNLIKNYKELYYKILLNQHDYTASKLPNSELLSCVIDEVNISFISLSQMQQMLVNLQYKIDEKLVFKLRLQILVKFKNFLINDYKKNVSPNEKGGFTFFGFLSKNSSEQIKDSKKEIQLNEIIKENYDFINSVIEKDVSIIDEHIKQKKHFKKNENKQIISFKCVKIDNFSFHLQSHRNHKIVEIMKISLNNFLLQSYESSISKKTFFVADEILLFDESLPGTKFKYIFTKSKLLNMNNRSEIQLKTCFDEILYDNDGFIIKVSEKKYHNIENHFVKFLSKNFKHEKMEKFSRSKIFIDCREMDFFVNLNFGENILHLKNLCVRENDIVRKNSKYMCINFNTKNKFSSFNSIKKEKSYFINYSDLDYLNVKMSRMRLLFLFNILSEDYRSFILQHEGLQIKSEDQFLNKHMIANLQFYYTNNFLILLNGLDKSREYKILYEINPRFDKKLIFDENSTEDTEVNNMIEIDDIRFYLNKIIIDSFLDYYSLLKYQIELLKPDKIELVLEDEHIETEYFGEDIDNKINIQQPNILMEDLNGENVNFDDITIDNLKYIPPLNNTKIISANILDSDYRKSSMRSSFRSILNENEFEEALESFEIQQDKNSKNDGENLNVNFNPEEKNSPQLQLKLPRKIKNISTECYIRSAGIYLEDNFSNSENSKNYNNIFISKISLKEYKVLNYDQTNYTRGKSDTPHISRVCKINHVVINQNENNFESFETDYSDILIKSNQFPNKNIKFEILINLNQLSVYRENIRNLMDNFFFYRDIIQSRKIIFKDLHRLEEGKYGKYLNKNKSQKLKKEIHLQLNIHKNEFFYDVTENSCSGLSNKKITLNGKFDICMIDQSSLNFSISNLYFHDKSFEFNMKSNSSELHSLKFKQEVKKENANSMKNYNIFIDEINVSIRNSIITNLKHIHELKNYLEEIKTKFFISNNNKNHKNRMKNKVINTSEGKLSLNNADSDYDSASDEHLGILSKFNVKLNSLKFVLYLFETSEIKMNIDNIILNHKHILPFKETEISYKQLSIFLIKQKASSNNLREYDSLNYDKENSEHPENCDFLSVHEFTLNKTRELTEINFSKEIKVRVLFYFLPVIRDINKFFMNLNNVIGSFKEVNSININSSSNNISNTSPHLNPASMQINQTTQNNFQKEEKVIKDEDTQIKQGLKLSINYLEIIIVDFFLKEKIDEITINNNFYLKAVFEKLTMDKNLNKEKLHIGFSFYISSSSEKIIKAYTNKKFELDDSATILDPSQNNLNEKKIKDTRDPNSCPQNIVINLKEKQLFIDSSMLNIIISENIISIMKLLRRYSTLTKHYLLRDGGGNRNNLNLSGISSSSSGTSKTSNLKIAQIFFQILKMDFFRIKFENIFIKFRTINDVNGIKIHNSLNIHLMYEFFFSQKLNEEGPNSTLINTTNNSIDNIFPPLHDFSSRISNFEVYFSTRIKKGEISALDENNYLVYPFDIIIVSQNDVNITINSIEVDFSIKKIAMVKSFMALLEDFSLIKKKKNLGNISPEKNSVPGRGSLNNLGENLSINRDRFDYGNNTTSHSESQSSNSSSFSKFSKRDLIKRAFFDFREINFKINNFTMIIAKEDIYNLKLYEPLFCLHLENLKMKYTSLQNISVHGEIKTEYFNNFNEFWEPILEKTRLSVCYSMQSTKSINSMLNKNNKIEVDFESGLNIVISIQFLKTFKVFIEDKNNLEKYKNSYNLYDFNTENFFNANFNKEEVRTENTDKTRLTQSMMSQNQKQGAESFTQITQFTQFTNSKLTINPAFNTKPSNKSSTVKYKFLNNYLQFENILRRNTYQFQIENNTGEELLMIIDDKHVIKISHMQIIPIEKILLLQNDIFTKPSSLANLASLKKSNSQTSLNSITSGDFKSTIQKKFRQQNEKLKELKFIKYIYFQIPELKTSFCINLLKNNQEIEIQTKNNLFKKIKILVTIYIDTNGRKVVSLKSPIKFKNNYSNYTLEMQMSNKEDFNSSQIFNFIIQPSTSIYIPIRYLNYNYFKVRPYISDSNYYQPYNYSEIIVRDFNILKLGKVINSSIKKYEGTNLTENVKMICSADFIQFDKLYQYEIVFDYTIELFNYLPSGIFLSLNKSINNVISLEPFTLSQFNFLSPDDLTFINILSLQNLSSGTFTHMSPPQMNVVKQIDINTLRINSLSTFEYNFINDNMNITSVKMSYENINKKIILSFYVDYIVINELDENVSMSILENNNYQFNQNEIMQTHLNQESVVSTRSKKLFLSSTYSSLNQVKSLQQTAQLLGLNTINKMNKLSSQNKNIINNLSNNIYQETVNTAGNIALSTRKISIESDLISITRRSESKVIGDNFGNHGNFSNFGNFNFKKNFIDENFENEKNSYPLDQSVNFIHFDNPGYDKILQFYNNKLPKILSKEIHTTQSQSQLNQFSTTMHKNLPNVTNFTSSPTNGICQLPEKKNSKLLIVPSHNNILYSHSYLHKRDLTTGYPIESNLQYFSTFSNDKIILKIEKSEEIEARFIKDVNNIYKNHYMKMTFKNKNMMEILCNVKYLNEYFKKEEGSKVDNKIDNKYNRYNRLNRLNKFNLTKIIFIKNKYVFVNNSNLNLTITQEGCFNEGFFILHSYDKINFKWINYEKTLMVKLKINESSFTNSFNIDTVGEFYLNLKLPFSNKFNSSNLILKISIVDNGGKIIVYIEESTHDPPFTIENNTNKVFKIVEKEKTKNNILSQPFTFVPFCFDNLTSNNVDIYECIGGIEEIENLDKFQHLVSFNMNKLEEEKKGLLKISNCIKVEILKNENMNYILKLSELGEEESSQIHMHMNNISMSMSMENLSEINFNENNINYQPEKQKIVKKNKNKFKLKALFIGLSFIDLTPKEVMYFHIKNYEQSLSIYNKKFYKFKFLLDSIQIDNSLENQYYEIIFKTLPSNYAYIPVTGPKINYKKSNTNKPIFFSIQFSHNQMGNIMFINSLNMLIKSDFLLNMDGIYISELWNFLKNVKKIFSQSQEKEEEDEIKQINMNLKNAEFENTCYEGNYPINPNRESENKVKILFNKIWISKISINFSFRPSFKMMKNLSKSQKLFFLLSKVENMNLIIDKFESQGVKSLETISTILAKNFMKKNNEIITKYLLSMDILLNVSNIFKHFKYGLDSIFDSIKLKKNDSFLMLPKQVVFGIINFFLIIIHGFNSSLIKFLSQVRNLTDFYYGNTIKFKINEKMGEEDLKKNWYIYSTLNEGSKDQFNKKFMFSKKFYFYLNSSLYNDYNKLLALNYFNNSNYYSYSSSSCDRYNYSKEKIMSYLNFVFRGIFKIIFVPLKVLVIISEVMNKALNKNLREKIKMKKIRPCRYINKNSCKIEEYSETRALAYVRKIILILKIFIKINFLGKTHQKQKILEHP